MFLNIAIKNEVTDVIYAKDTSLKIAGDTSMHQN